MNYFEEFVAHKNHPLFDWAADTIIKVLLKQQEDDENRQDNDNDSGQNNRPVGAVRNFECIKRSRDDLQARIRHIEQRIVEIIVNINAWVEETFFKTLENVLKNLTNLKMRL